MKGAFLFVLVFISVVCITCDEDKKVFKRVPSAKSGIEFVNKLNPTEDLNILTYLYYYNGAGVAMADFNNDQLNDIYFTSNQGADKLYINKGHLSFVDATVESGINNSTGWTTGVTYADVNSDGLLDIYVCKVGGYDNIPGSNLLYINQGADARGIPSFREEAAAYGLDLSTFSTQSAFFDYDLDGDLDMFLLTHSVYPNRSYGRGKNRMVKDPDVGDKFFENIDGKFVDVTDDTGIYQSKIGYGLGLAISDLNNDGFPDIYIGNDFFENDYCYLNNRNKTFKELISDDERIFGHTTHYSMGNCAADINNDGRIDILSADMLPADLITLKSSGQEDGFPIYNQFLKNGYAPQFMQNTLHINRGENMFSEVAFQAGIASSEWSWSVLAADFDMDGMRDVFVTNGIVGATNDMDYIHFISQDSIQRTLENNKHDGVLQLTTHIPQKKLPNYFFHNDGNVSFSDVTASWIGTESSFSNGAAYADLDNDGDLDLVVNNTNAEAFIFENTTRELQKRHYLTVRFSGPAKNRFGVGARIEIYAEDLFVCSENFPVRSYLSSVPHEIITALGDHNRIDSLRVVWPDQSRQTLYNVKVDTVINLSYENAMLKGIAQIVAPDFLENVPAVEFVHQENSTLDFERDPLIPFALSNEGPGISVGDANKDGRDDLFICGAKMQASQLFVQDNSGKLINTQPEVFAADALSEDVDNCFTDVDADGDLDLVVVAGGNEFSSGEQLRPRLYRNNSGKYQREGNAFLGLFVNASVVKPLDFDNDGDNDLAIGSNALPGKFGEQSKNYLLLNDGTGKFEVAPAAVAAVLTESGLINDIALADLDGNGFIDIIAVGDWMPVTLFFNDGKTLVAEKIDDSQGWWKSIGIGDMDKDGDVDIVAGNWGSNTRLRASKDQPVELYRGDFDNNGAVETLITYYFHGKRTLLASKDELQRQVPSIKKKFQTYKGFAAADVEEVISSDKLNAAKHLNANVLESCYFENTGDNKFKKRALPNSAQQSSVNAVLIEDFNYDGYPDMLLAGNNYEISTQLGRLDAMHGTLLLNNKSGFFNEQSIQNFNIAGPARDISLMRIRSEQYCVVSINNGTPFFLKMHR